MPLFLCGLRRWEKTNEYMASFFVSTIERIFYLKNFTALLSGIFMSIFFLSACSATGPQFHSFQIPTEKNVGVLYVYRPSRLGGAIYPIYVYDQKKDVRLGKLWNGGYFEKVLPVGKYQITNGSLQPTDIEIEIKENQITCVKTQMMRSILPVGFSNDYIPLLLVPEDVCGKEIKNMKYND